MKRRNLRAPQWFVACATIMLALLNQGCPWNTNDIASPVDYVADTNFVEISNDELLHIVARGETLYGVGKLYGVSPAVIARRNSLGSHLIEPGQLLAIPRPDSPGKPDAITAADSPVASESVATVSTPAESRFAWPVRGQVVQKYGSSTDAGTSRGIDIAASPGQKVLAAKSGSVRFASQSLRGMGKVVILDHGSSEWTLYGHLGAIDVSPGDRISQGDALGTAGQTGRATSTQLHFRIYRWGRPVDPLPLLSR